MLVVGSRLITVTGFTVTSVIIFISTVFNPVATILKALRLLSGRIIAVLVTDCIATGTL